MREHLYRAKDLKSGEWVYGNLIETQDREYTEYAILEKTAEHRYGGEYGDDGWHKVKPETIGQFIGLLDKNGNKIFDDDIVAVCDLSTGYSKRRIEKVEYDESSCGYWFYHFKGDIHFVELIGNIYDNPDLINK